MVWRVFEARPGRQPELLRCLKGIAADMIQRRNLNAVQICRHADSADRITWIEDRRAASLSGSVLEAEVAGICADALARTPVSQPFELVDGFYRYPLPSCQVWSLEASPPSGREDGALADLLGRARAASAEPAVAGMSVYRAVGSPGVLAFVALSETVVPPGGSLFSPTVAAPGSWRRLLVVWTMGRLLGDPDRRGPAPSALYPGPTFWARSMPVLAVAPMREDS